MAKAYEYIYPNSGKQLLDGGKNNKFERSIIDDRESPDCANVIFNNGAVATRNGSTRLNTTPVGSFVCDGIYTRRSNTQAETMVVFAGGTMWQLSGASTFSTVSSAQSVFTAGVRVSTCQYENHMFIGNGGVTPYKYNGTDFTRHGVYPPTSSLTVASGAAGNLAGTYMWKVTFVNSQLVEGNGGPATTFVVTATGGQVTLSNIPVGAQSFGVATRRVYRTDAGGTIFHRITTLSDNTTTTFADNVASSAVGATMPADNGVPPNYSICITHANRVFVNDAANPNLVYYSELGEPYTYTTLGFDLFGDNAADLIKGFAIFDNSLVVFCENSQWLWYMESPEPSDWRKIQIRSNFGSKSPFGSAKFENKVFFPAMQNDKFVGYAAINGDSIEPSATLLTVSAAGSELQSDRIEPDIFEGQEAYVSNISSLTYKNKIYTTFTYGSGSTQNNRVYVFDFSISDLNRKNPAWAPFLNLSATQFTVFNGNLYYGSSLADGFVSRLETNVYSDNSTAINSYFWTKEFSGLKGHENEEKDFRRINMLVDMAGDYFMTVSYRVDSDSGEGTSTQVDLNPGGSIWGAFNWGEANWGGGKGQQNISVFLAGARGKRIQFKFTNQNTVNQRFKIHSINFTYNLRGTR